MKSFFATLNYEHCIHQLWSIQITLIVINTVDSTTLCLPKNANIIIDMRWSSLSSSTLCLKRFGRLKLGQISSQLTPPFALSSRFWSGLPYWLLHWLISCRFWLDLRSRFDWLPLDFGWIWFPVLIEARFVFQILVKYACQVLIGSGLSYSTLWKLSKLFSQQYLCNTTPLSWCRHHMTKSPHRKF